jgi:hypothetical protein
MNSPSRHVYYGLVAIQCIGVIGIVIGAVFMLLWLIDDHKSFLGWYSFITIVFGLVLVLMGEGYIRRLGAGGDRG